MSCQQKRVRICKDRTYDAIYSLEISDQIYELLSYRVLADRQKTLRWSLPEVICQQLRTKYQTIDKFWGHLAICTEWPNEPEIDKKHLPKIKLKICTHSTEVGGI